MFWSYFASIKYVNAKVFYLIYALLFKLSGQLVLCMACVAFAAYQSLYPIMLLVPAALYFAQVNCYIYVKLFGSTYSDYLCVFFQ